MHPEEVIADLEHRVSQLEEIVDAFMNGATQAVTMAEVNVAAGIARDALHGVDLGLSA